MSDRAQLVKLYKEYNLTPTDMFKHAQGWTIIRRTGIDKIQAQSNVVINYEVLALDREFCVVMAKASLGDNYIETFGEADRKTNCKNQYHVAIAEKRAMSRAVLKLTGFYQAGAYSEEESPDFSKEESDKLYKVTENSKKVKS